MEYGCIHNVPFCFELVIQQDVQLQLCLCHLLRLHLLLLLVSRDDQDVSLDVNCDGDHEKAGGLGEELAVLQVDVSLLSEAVLERQTDIEL